MSILQAKKFFQHYTDATELDCIALGRKANLHRKDVLKYTESDKEIQVSFVDYDEELGDSASVKLEDIKLVSDVTIWAD